MALVLTIIILMRNVTLSLPKDILSARLRFRTEPSSSTQVVTPTALVLAIIILMRNVTLSLPKDNFDTKVYGTEPDEVPSQTAFSLGKSLLFP
jgi:hypothetical protein